MQKFKVSVSKGGKKYTLVLSDENEILVRKKVHKEGYSILGIEQISESSFLGHKYIFEGEKNGERKKGKIIGDDIFKVYLKLRKELGYSVFFLYTENDENIEKEKKEKIIQELEEEYDIFVGKAKNNKKEEHPENTQKNKQDQKELKNFYLKKELEETYKLIDFVLQKIKVILDSDISSSFDKTEKENIKNIYNSIIKLKKTTNISKLKEVGEIALLKIGELELNLLEKRKDTRTKELLRETNKLLKKIGSKTQFIEKNKDIHFLFKSFIYWIKEYFKISLQKNVSTPEKEKVDISSYSYIKNERLLKKYKEKLSLNTKEILENIFSSSKRGKLLLRRQVIKQNILLLELRKKGISFSYTSLKKGYGIIFEKIIQVFFYLKICIFPVLVLYSLIFIIHLNYSIYYDSITFSYSGIFYFIILSLLYFVFSFSKTFFSFILNFFIFYSFILFSIINF